VGDNLRMTYREVLHANSRLDLVMDGSIGHAGKDRKRDDGEPLHPTKLDCASERPASRGGRSDASIRFRMVRPLPCMP
jgi:hypothetical protein